MLLSVHVTRVLFLVRFNNFALTMGVTCSYLSHSFVCTLAREMLHHPEVSLSKYIDDKTIRPTCIQLHIRPCEAKAAARSCTNEWVIREIPGAYACCSCMALTWSKPQQHIFCHLSVKLAGCHLVMWSQANIHTHMRNAVMLDVWGSLRLTSIIKKNRQMDKQKTRMKGHFSGFLALRSFFIKFYVVTESFLP